MKINTFLPFLLFLFIVLGCGGNYRPDGETATSGSSSQIETVPPVFNVSNLVGKSPAEADKVLGSPLEAWTTKEDSKRQMRDYSKTADNPQFLVSFYNNRIEALTYFFDSPVVSDDTAFRLLGLDLGNRKPDSNTGASRIYNNFKIKGSSADIVVASEWIKITFKK